MRLVLLVLVIGEAVLIGSIWKATEPVTVRGALSKHGPHYVLRWENSDKTSETKIFSSPIEAIEFAKAYLSLAPGNNPRFEDSLENLWVRKEMGRKLVYWKTLNYTGVHRLTFDNESHAKFFESSFKAGAYSPSPIGHAIYLKSTLE